MAMTNKEAIDLVLKDNPDMDVDKVTETTNYFIVSIFPKNMRRKDGIDLEICDDGLKAVDKKTKKIFTYNPMVHGD